MEGGTFVLYMILSRYFDLDNYTPKITADPRRQTIVETGPTIEIGSEERVRKGDWIRKSKIARLLLLGWCLYGASSVIADGILTPAVSVIEAVSGFA